MSRSRSEGGSRWGNMLTVLGFVAGLALVVAGLFRQGLLSSSPELGYGAQLEGVHLEGPRRVSVRKGNWYFFVVGNLEEQGTLLTYIETLRATPWLRMGNVVPVAMIDGYDVSPRIDEYVGEHEISYPILPLHGLAPGDLSMLGINDHRNRYFMLDPELRVVFYSEFMKSKDLRMLMEKYFSLGPRAQQEMEAIEVGDTLFFDSPVPVWPGQAEFDPRSRILIVFTSGCVSCSLDNRLGDVALHQATLKGVGSLQGLGVGVVFGSAFARSEVRNRLEEIGVDIPAFVSNNLVGIEDPYVRNSLQGADALIVKTDSDARVTDIASLQGYLSSIFNDEVQD